MDIIFVRGAAAVTAFFLAGFFLAEDDADAVRFRVGFFDLFLLTMNNLKTLTHE